MNGVDLAKKYKLSTNTIPSIKTGRKWSQITNKNYITRVLHWIEFNGNKMILSDWARLLKVHHVTLSGRIKLTSSFEEAYNYYKNKNEILK